MQTSVSELFFNLKDWRAWTPDRDTLQAWQSWAGVGRGSSSEERDIDRWPQAEPVPMMLRRRAGTFGQRVLGTALGCRGASDRYVFASRHGELSRTVEILSAVAGGETPSPAEFSMSVHHALAGLLSIQAGNRQGHTAVAAGVDTFGFGFLESLALIASEPETSVLLVYHDAALPQEYAELEPEEDPEPLVVALRMTAADPQSPAYAFEQQPAERDDDSGKTKQPAHDFLRFLLTGAPAVRSAGARMNWQWRRVA